MLPAKGTSISQLESSVGAVLIRGILRWLLRLLFRVEVRGIENVPAGGYILVANHLNWIDGFLLLAFLPATPRLYVLADRFSIYRTWWKRWVVTVVGRVITIDRTHNHGDPAAMRTALRALENGDALGLFPEGALGNAEGRIGRLQRGIGALCLHSGRPVLPVGLSGVQELYYRKGITVTIGNAFSPTSKETAIPRRIDDLTAQVQAALERTLHPYREEPVARKPMRWLTNLLS